MISSASSLAILGFALQAAADTVPDYSAWAFGAMYQLGPVQGAYIAKATYSLVAPAAPCGATTEDTSDPPFMSIWTGVSDSISDETTPLVQPLLNWSPDQASQGCPASDTEWCVAASTYFLSGQVGEAYIRVPNNSKIDFEIVAESSENVTQKVWIDGSLVSQQTDSVGFTPTYIYSSNECYQDTCGTVNTYTWSNLTLTLSAADENFGSTLQLYNATSDGLTTSDNGKTWHTDSIVIKKDHFPGKRVEHYYLLDTATLFSLIRHSGCSWWQLRPRRALASVFNSACLHFTFFCVSSIRTGDGLFVCLWAVLRFFV